MTALNGVAQTIPTDTAVLKYLYKEAANSYYLKKDTANLGQILSNQKKQLVIKDSLITNSSKALSLCDKQAGLIQLELKNSIQTNKSLTKKVNVFKTISISVALLGSITTILALFR